MTLQAQQARLGLGLGLGLGARAHVGLATWADSAGLDSVQPGENITVHFNLRGREWTSPQGEIKYFNTLEAWKIDKAGASTGGDYSQSVPDYESMPAPAKDDLPF